MKDDFLVLAAKRGDGSDFSHVITAPCLGCATCGRPRATSSDMRTAGVTEGRTDALGGPIKSYTDNLSWMAIWRAARPALENSLWRLRHNTEVMRGNTFTHRH